MLHDIDPVPGSVWRHWEGNVYRVVAVAGIQGGARDGDPMVVYEDARGQTWTRDLPAFVEHFAQQGPVVPPPSASPEKWLDGAETPPALEDTTTVLPLSETVQDDRRIFEAGLPRTRLIGALVYYPAGGDLVASLRALGGAEVFQRPRHHVPEREQGLLVRPAPGIQWICDETCGGWATTHQPLVRVPNKVVLELWPRNPDPLAWWSATPPDARLSVAFLTRPQPS